MGASGRLDWPGLDEVDMHALELKACVGTDTILGELYQSWIGGGKALVLNGVYRECTRLQYLPTKKLGTERSPGSSDKWDLGKIRESIVGKRKAERYTDLQSEELCRRLLVGDDGETLFKNGQGDSKRRNRSAIRFLRTFFRYKIGAAPEFIDEGEGSVLRGFVLREQESAYEMLRLSHPGRATKLRRVLIISGGSAFDVGLVGIGLAAASRGVEYVYVCPVEKVDGKSVAREAFKSIQGIEQRLKEFGGSSVDHPSRDFVTLVGSRGRQDSEKDWVARFKKVLVDPVEMKELSVDPWDWGGQFLNPAFRFVYLQMSGETESQLYISRKAQEGTPFAYKATSWEVNVLSRWVKLFVDGNEQAILGTTA